MKTGRNVHVPKTPQMKQLYRRYIETQDYEPTVDDRMHFGQSSQAGEELSTKEIPKRRPVSLGDKVRDHLSNNWLVWVLGGLAAGIIYLVSDSKVAFTKFETLLTTQSEKIADLKSILDASQKNAHSQDLKIQENSIRINHLQNDVTEIRSKVDKVTELQHNRSGRDSTGVLSSPAGSRKP
jgi:hypothetical protein